MCTKVLKYVANIISLIPTDIINMCVEEGTIPKGLKIAIIKPLNKKGNKELMESYRPAAFTSFSKSDRENCL